MTFEYDGTNFNGWQKQPNGRTVQGVIEQAFNTFYQQKIKIVGQGRTDAGVHAKGQVAHADLPEMYSVNRLYRAMHGLLPEDVVLINAEKAEKDFHARFHAKSRRYQYMVLNRYSPLMRYYSWAVFKPLSFDLLNKCAHLIKGEQDFLNFCIPPEGDEMNTTCEIFESKWCKQPNAMVFTVEGNRFLRHLVRRLVGAMVQVAEGTLQISDFQILLSAQKMDRKGHAAPAKGLTLLSVRY